MKRIITVIVALMLLIGASVLSNADRQSNRQADTQPAQAEIGYNADAAE